MRLHYPCTFAASSTHQMNPVLRSTSDRYPVTGLAGGRLDCLTPGFRPDPWTFDASTCRIYNAANKNANDSFPYLPGSEAYALEHIASTINKYIDGVQRGKIPQYSDLMLDGATPSRSGKLVAAGNPAAVIQWLTLNAPDARRYSNPENFVRVVLYWMDRLAYTLEGNAPAVHPGMAWPLTADARDPQNPVASTYYTNQVEAVKRDAQNSLFGDANEFMRNILFIALGIGAVYVLWPLIIHR